MTLFFMSRKLNDLEALPVRLNSFSRIVPLPDNCSHSQGAHVEKRVQVFKRTVDLIVSDDCKIKKPPKKKKKKKKIAIVINTINGAMNIKISQKATVGQLRKKAGKKMNLLLNGVDLSHSSYKKKTLTSLGICNGTILNVIGNQMQQTPVVFLSNFMNPVGGIDIYASNSHTYAQAPQFPLNLTIPPNSPLNTVVINSNPAI